MYPKLNCFDPCDVAYDWHNTDSDNWNRFATEHARKNSCGPMWQQAGCNVIVLREGNKKKKKIMSVNTVPRNSVCEKSKMKNYKIFLTFQQ